MRGPAHAVRFLGALAQYHSPEFAKTHVKALCIRPSIPLTLTLHLLSACSGLDSLALWNVPQSDTAELVHRLSALPLTSLSLNIRSIVPPSAHKFVLENHPVFVNLTHLDIVNHWVLWTSSLGIEHLPQLTHVAFSFWPRGNVNSALSTILSQSPRLRVLVLLADRVVIPGAKEYLERHDIMDTRVVVLEHARDADEWERMRIHNMDASAGMWTRADRIAEWRERNRGQCEVCVFTD